jgi:hypothetical protein
VAIGVNDVIEADDVRVVHLLQERNLSDGGTGNSLILGLKANLLERNDSSRMQKILCLVNDTVCSCTEPK